MPKIPSNYRALETSARKPRANARRTGPADPNEILTVSVSVRVRPDAPPLPTPEKMAAAPRGGKRYITREDFAAASQGLNSLPIPAKAICTCQKTSPISSRAFLGWTIGGCFGRMHARPPRRPRASRPCRVPIR